MNTAVLELNSGPIRCPVLLLWLFGSYVKGRLRACYSSWSEAGWDVDAGPPDALTASLSDSEPEPTLDYLSGIETPVRGSESRTGASPGPALDYEQVCMGCGGRRNRWGRYCQACYDELLGESLP